ncbi:MAG: HipA domain-containing protein [Phycisphaerales bacterium]|nr:HipA domain-containing protein [Phycisphaerales bacterium]
MSSVCLICLGDVRAGEGYHARCARRLFGTARIPTIDLALSKIHTAALAMVGHTTFSGVQKKISVGFSTDRKTLQVVTEGGRYILKPQTETYPALPENEHVTTRLAELVDVAVAPSGLIHLSDGTRAFIVQRFDRRSDGRKVHQEDFCQLAEQPPRAKYAGTAELCVRLLRKFATEPPVEILKLFRMLVFGWWTGNGDVHLKNLSVLVDPRGIVKLTPAYDQVCTRLVIPQDTLALPVGGKKDNLSRKSWLAFAEYAGLTRKAAERVLERQAAALAPAQELLERCCLPAEQKARYADLLAARTRQLV